MKYPFRHFAFSLFLFPFAISLFRSATAHSGNRVYYTVQPQSDSTVLLRVTLHEHDLAGLLASEQACAPTQDLTICAIDLIRQKMSVTINGVVSPLVPNGTSSTQHDVVLLFVLRFAPSQIDTITITNTCFVTTTPDLENIVSFKLKDDVLYSMNRQRTSITHVFKVKP